MMLRFCFLLWLGLIVQFAVMPANAADVSFPERPTNGSFLIDEGNMLNEAEEAEINKIAAQLFVEQRIPIIVATIPSLGLFGAESLSIEAYARRLFDHWGIGSQERNYGMLVLVSYFDRKARIEFGASYAGRYNREAEDIMQGIIIPAFKEYRYGKGLVGSVVALDSVARGLGVPFPEVNWLYVIIGGVLGSIFVMLITLNLINAGRTGWAFAFLAFIGLVLYWIYRNRGRGGGAFGGGSGGGGGASGGW